ncbi:palmitoyltransferase [Brettanomyces nanus]|uniref:Synaptobrevin homolog YKT6 n=1 Tax=Eeniella nana TaxID=13502 RepID=A0A875RWC7_EENNA|nr:palmitoyltransferase [Brettanomyces nanus]QPG73531.1 palmitoyltransferase [Brettanomyces nanus]
MKLYYMGIIRPKSGSKKTLTLCEQKNLADFSFFQKNSVGQFMTFFSETIAERTKPSQRQSVEEGNYVGHVYTRAEGVSGVLITDKDYPIRPAYTLLNKLLDEYISQHPASDWQDLDEATDICQMDQLSDYIIKYQNPTKADAIMKVQQELDDTKIVLQKSIESVLQRGEQLDSLVDKSEALTASSKTFYKQAKKTNSCCVIV